MDPGGSDLDSSLPHPENPCLIVEDSQPDSAALEDDPDSSYRALLARRLSSLQPATSHSPVLELISSPAGNRYSETDSQSERIQNNNHNGPVNQEESQVLEVCSLPNTRRCATGGMAMESGADSTTQCAQSEGGVSQFGFLELSESQGLGEVVGNSQEEEGPTAAQTDSQRHNKPGNNTTGEQKNMTTGLPSGSQDSKSKRSEVSSSSSSESLGRAGRELSVQALLHSQGLQASEDQDPKGDDSELLSSQEDLFDADRTGTRVDSTVSEPENQAVPTLTPANTLRLLHLSGQGTLVQESLSQNSVDFVAPTQENLSQTPFIVPSSPTGQENEMGADEPMDTSMPPEDQSDGKEEEPMDMDPAPKSRPSASTPVFQNSPDFVLERTLSLPTQPEFSHDVFVPTQSQEAGSSSTAPQEMNSRKVTSSSQPTSLESSSSKMAAAAAQPKAPTTTDRERSVTDSFQLELSVNTQSCSLAQQASMQAGGKDVEEDSQATQIEEGLDGPLRKDTSDSVMSRNSQKRESNGVPSDPKTSAILPKVPQVPDLLKTSGESARREECNTSQKSDTHKQTTLNVRSVNVGHDGINVTKTDSSQKQNAKASSPSPSSQQKLETIDLLTPSSCVQETPSSSNSTPCSLASLSQSQAQSVFSQMSRVGSVKALSPSPGVSVDSRRDGGGRREVGEAGGGGVGSPISSQKNQDPAKSRQSLSQERGGTATNSPKEKNIADEEEMEEEGEKQQDSTLGPEGSGLYLSLSQSQVLSPEPMEEGGEEEEKQGRFPVSHSRSEGGGEEESCGSVIVLEESERSSQLLEKEVTSPSKMGTSQPVASRRGSVSSNGTGSQLKDTQRVPIGLSQTEKGGSREAEGLRDKSLSDSSGEIPFHFTLPKEGELIGPPVSATPPLISQLKQTPRHSTPIEMTFFSEKSAAAGDVSTETAMATSEIMAGESGEDTAEGDDGKLSLRMKLVTPVEEGSSERFSLQKPPLSDEEGSVSKVTTVVKAVTSPLPSPSVFSRVREAHRQVMEDQAEAHPSGPGTPVRGELFSSPSQQTSSQRPTISSPSLGCISLPNSQSEPPSSPRQEVKCMLSLGLREKAPPAEPSTPGRPAVPTPQTGTAAGERESCGPPEPSTPTRAAAIRQRAVSQQTSFDNTISPSSPSKLCQRVASQQTSFDAAGPRSPTASGEPETPPSRAAAGPTHRRHVRTIQEVRTTVTRIITDVYYEDGREVDRKVTEESEEPVVDSRVLDSDISPCRTGSSMTSGDLGDVSSLSSKASSLQHSSGGTSTVRGPAQRGPDFIMPPSRGAKSASPRRGSGPQQRGHRGQVAGSEFMGERVQGLHGSRAFTPLTPRGRARRGRPPSRSPLSRGAGVPRANARGQPLSSSEDEPYTRLCPTPRIPDSPAVPSHSSTSLLTTTSPDEGSPAGSSFVGLRVVAKWSSNGYFYSGRITKDLGEGRFRLLFDDSYECEVTGKDILLCDPIPLDTEVTALLEDEYFSTGLVKGYKTEGKELFYSVEKQGQTTATTAGEREGQTTATTAGEREGQTTATTAGEREGQTTATTVVERQWYNRSSVILTMEQGNRLREQYGLGPYEPSTPLTKASDISLDNLVEGKRRRRGITGGAQGTPNRSSDSPRTPGPSGKRKLISSEDRDRERTPAKRGRRGGGGPRAGQRVGVCNTSGSGTDLPCDHGALLETHGPLPQSASLFLGFAFMLTASSESDRQTNQPISDGEEEYVQTAPYHKRYTETQLEAGGGFILQDFNEEQCKAAYQSLLITDQHSRTRKYLLCVASGVPCVSHIWVRDSCKEGKLLNYRNYLLPAGVGPDDRIVEWHPRCSPFKALRVLLVFEKPVELWSELLTMSGASSVRQHQADKDSSDIPGGKFDVVVTDRTCPPLVLKSVTSQEVPMVSPEWLIHSLICGERLGYHSNPQYHHDYTSPPSS
ncbi:TP53-binding protein 1 isoform X1 [Coregonus clupeaformis]|uniref:TP53-binding protein 1 isoform X1 n=2 Tax=Coregonus clupeaformis TaxID=59861 RepID=UPI001E1C3CD2|nr:TP53-binding protein 1 isoform X1 [Coregonus clupeaformis]XP_045065529.1 TP53-binding protein 1 isoform X1 [Coregonus clupeaformis]XP_045065530.1 TP53-binding protein 1 isoform X1 [Coregonus clupeaformis]XP_045065531.1 TP53-binding protein 1 isoform X1 [Coregonus clupeaformis]